MFQKGCRFSRDTLFRDQILHRDRMIRKTADRQNWSVQRDRIDDRIDTGTVFQSRIHDRRIFIDNAVAFSGDLLHDIFQLFSGHERLFPSAFLSVPLHEDLLIPVYHDLCHPVIIQQFLQNIQFSHRIKQFSPDLLSPAHRQPVLSCCLRHQLIDPFQNRLIRPFHSLLQLFHQSRPHAGKLFLFHHPSSHSFRIISLT